MGAVRTDEFRKDAVWIAQTSGLSRKQIANDLGVGMSTLNKWITAHRDPGAAAYEERHRSRVLANLHRPAKSLGFTLAPMPDAEAVS